MKDLKLIAFDLEGVLLDSNAALLQIAKETQIEPSLLKKYIINHIKQLETGELDSIEFWSNFINYYELKKDPQQIFYSWVLNHKLLNNNWLMAKKYKSMGYKLAICTNSWTGLVKIFIQNFPDLNIFDYIFDSTKIGYVKPQKEFFKFVENETNFKGGEILLIDDSRENIEGAKRYGWRTLIINNN
jgi:putative hydrolase of the HAD superfamily